MTSEALAPMVTEAIKLWGSLIPSSSNIMALDKVELKIADLPGALLGQGKIGELPLIFWWVVAVSR